MNHYENSWAIYKAHSESFIDDFDYYYDFTKGFRSLETFAGYGRVGNYLSEKGIDLSINELLPDFTNFLKIPENKVHIGSVLDFKSDNKFERIFAAYNSFCLLLADEQVRQLFTVLESNLVPGGQVSLSYYHPDSWKLAVAYSFDFKGNQVEYTPSFNLENRLAKRGVWRDLYKVGNEEFDHEYNVRIYEDASDLEVMLTHTKLKIIKEIKNYNNPKILEPGWIEYVLELPL